MAGTMREAMLKAGLLKTEMEEDRKYRIWKSTAYKNRFGDIALFELWATSRLPEDYWEHCALCGKTHFEHIQWIAPNKIKYAICPMCYVHGRENDRKNFKDLEGK